MLLLLLLLLLFLSGHGFSFLTALQLLMKLNRVFAWNIFYHPNIWYIINLIFAYFHTFELNLSLLMFSSQRTWNEWIWHLQIESHISLKPLLVSNANMTNFIVLRHPVNTLVTAFTKPDNFCLMIHPQTFVIIQELTETLSYCSERWSKVM